MTAAPVDQLAEALDVTEQLVGGVRDEQWANPTPCTDWTVRDLVNHLVAGNRLFAGILRGEDSPSLADPRGPQGIDSLGEHPPAAYRDAAEQLLSAFRQPGVLQQMFTVPIGRVPGIAALHLRTIESLVHGWDLAQATRQDATFRDDLVEQELAFTRERLTDVPPGRTPFAPPQPVAAAAPAIDRLAALLGRQVAQG